MASPHFGTIDPKFEGRGSELDPASPQEPANSLGLNNPQKTLTPRLSFSKDEALDYRHRNWNGYELKTMFIRPEYLNTYCGPIFDHFDSKKKGFLDISMTDKLLKQFFHYLQLPPPTQDQIGFLKIIHDEMNEGIITKKTFYSMVAMLGGIDLQTVIIAPENPKSSTTPAKK